MLQNPVEDDQEYIKLENSFIKALALTIYHSQTDIFHEKLSNYISSISLAQILSNTRRYGFHSPESAQVEAYAEFFPSAV